LQGISSVAGKNVKIFYDEGISNRHESKVYQTSVFESQDGQKGLKANILITAALTTNPF